MTGRADEIRAVTSKSESCCTDFYSVFLIIVVLRPTYFDIGLHIDSILKEEKKVILQETFTVRCREIVKYL